MIGRFDAILRPIDNFIRNHEDSCSLLELSFEIIKDGRAYEIRESPAHGFECTDSDIKVFLDLCESYLRGRLGRDTRFGFSLPEKHERYIYPFGFETKKGIASTCKQCLVHNQ